MKAFFIIFLAQVSILQFTHGARKSTENLAPGFNQREGENVHNAALFGMVDAMRAEIRADPSKIELRTKENLTPLLIGCKFSQIEIIELLIQSGANPKVKDENATTCLHYLCHQPNLERMTIFFEAVDESKFKVKMNALDNMNLTPLYYCTTQASDEEGIPIINLLLDHGASVNSRESIALITAVGHNKYQLAELLLSRGALIQKNTNGLTPFIFLFHGPFRVGVPESAPMNFGKRLALLKQLIKVAKEQNVFEEIVDSPFTHGRNKWTSLYLAFRERDFGAVTVLLQSGARLLERENDMPSLWDNFESYDIEEKYVTNPTSRILFLETRDWTVTDVSHWLNTMVNHLKIREKFVGLRGAQVLKLKPGQLQEKTEVLKGTTDEDKIKELASQVEEMKSGRRTGQVWSKFWDLYIQQYPEFSPDAVLQTTTASALADSATNLL